LPGQGIYQNPQFLAPGVRLTIQGHCSDVTGHLGIEFLETRPKDKPFFLMLHYKAPHRSVGAGGAPSPAVERQGHSRTSDAV
jgi:hypothetical protein